MQSRITAFIKLHECSGQVSAPLLTCPHCGDPAVALAVQEILDERIAKMLA